MQAMKENQRFAWIRYVNLFVCLILCVSLLRIFLCTPKSIPMYNQIKTLDATNYPEALPLYRKQFMNHLGNNTYLDYTGAGVYPDEIVEQYYEALTQSNPLVAEPGNGTSSEEIIARARKDLLRFLGTDEEHYSVVFLASATQALKLVGENFPWTKKSRFFYTRYNHNSVLGIRRYAIAHGAKFNATRNFNSLLAIARNMTTPGTFTHLLAMPLEENFAGTKPTADIMREISHINGSYAIIADAAAYLPTNKLNLTEYPFHAVDMSFYKIFGFPNYGALVIRNDFARQLKKTYYTAHSAEAVQSSNDAAKLAEFPQCLEDDVVTPENALALSMGISFLERIGMDKINAHVAKLTKKMYHGLAEMNVRMYGNHYLNDDDQQGGIVAFNLLRSDGQFYGYAAVVEEMSKSGFHLRGGCHCNPGACFNATGLKEYQVKDYFNKKTTCGDKYDVIDGIPLGAVRASLGWASIEKDVDDFLEHIRNNYIM